MQKFYSIVLMAVALLIGTNVKAATTVTTEQQLLDAFANNEVSEIVLQNDLTLNQSAVLKDGRELKLNLGGNKIDFDKRQFTYQAPIVLVHGTLHVYNGTINNNYKGTADNSAAILVFGAGYNKNTGLAMDNETEWSNLIIGDGKSETFINAENTYTHAKSKTDATQVTENSGAGVEVYTFGTKWSVNTKNNGWSYGGGLYPKVTNTYTKADPKVPTFGTYAAKNAALAFLDGLDYEPSHQGEKNAAFGVNITVKANASVYGSKYGLQISGQVQATGNNVPVLNVENGAKVSAHGTAAEATGIYAAGVGETNINGEVHGSTGVYIKSGEVNVGDGAVVYSDNDTYNDVDHKRSGVDAGGSAIIYETNKAYGGQITINVTDGATITGNSGYAIQGAQEPDVDNELKGINIQGGTIVAGTMGALETQVLEEAIKTGGATLVVDGATIQTDETDMSDLNDLLSVAGSTSLIGQTEDGTYVIEQAPTGTTVVKNQDLNTTSEKYVELQNGTAQTLTKDVELTYLALQNTTVNVPAGMTLKVGSIVMDAKAVINVAAGAKLVLTDVNGLVANNVNNIKIAYENGVSGIFMLTPAAKANKNPAATVALTSTKAYLDGSNFVFERIGIPAVNGMTLKDIVKVTNPASTYGFLWDTNTQDWYQLTNTEVLPPFTGIAFTSEAKSAGNLYNFPCNLLGNSNVDLTIKGEWTYFANSYMAPVDMKAFASAIRNAGEGVAAGAYLDPAGTGNWVLVSLRSLEEGIAEYANLTPMQGFILHNDNDNPTTANATVDYENMVWDPMFDPDHQVAKGIAARKANYDGLTRIKITISAENGNHDEITLRQSEEFTNEYDNGADFKQFMGLNTVNIYANTEIGALAEVATNDINGLSLNVNGKEANSYKMTFSYVCGEQMAIRDNLTGATITMVEGAEYFFTATEGDNANRFQIIGINNAPTAIENVATEGAKAVYTVLGQYMGTTDNWNTLPNGIYVVDGVKMVK